VDVLFGDHKVPNRASRFCDLFKNEKLTQTKNPDCLRDTFCTTWKRSGGDFVCKGGKNPRFYGNKLNTNKGFFLFSKNDKGGSVKCTRSVLKQ
jgi:hypothetical protein